MAARGYTKHERWESPATIGFLGATKHAAWSEFLPPFEQRLRELGWIDGHNLHIDYRWAEGRADRYGKIAKGFFGRGVDVIVTASTPAAAAAKAATRSIPIVVASAGDPVGTGLVRSLARPGGNLTGLSNGQTDLAGKRLELLRTVVPGLHTLAIIGNRASPNVRLEIAALQKNARKLKIDTIVRDVAHEPQIASAIKQLKGKADALYVCTDPFVVHHAVSLNTLATSAGLPTMHAFRDHVERGGLISYGPNFHDMFRSAADLVDRILRGAKPADIPVKLEKKREIVINLNTARALSLRIPKQVRRRAETIQ